MTDNSLYPNWDDTQTDSVDIITTDSTTEPSNSNVYSALMTKQLIDIGPDLDIITSNSNQLPTDKNIYSALATKNLIDSVTASDSLVVYDDTTKQYTLKNDANDRTLKIQGLQIGNDLNETYEFEEYADTQVNFTIESGNHVIVTGTYEYYQTRDDYDNRTNPVNIPFTVNFSNSEYNEIDDGYFVNQSPQYNIGLGDVRFFMSDPFDNSAMFIVFITDDYDPTNITVTSVVSSDSTSPVRVDTVINDFNKVPENALSTATAITEYVTNESNTLKKYVDDNDWLTFKDKIYSLKNDSNEYLFNLQSVLKVPTAVIDSLNVTSMNLNEQWINNIDTSMPTTPTDKSLLTSKAVKDYVDSQSGGGLVVYDDTTKQYTLKNDANDKSLKIYGLQIGEASNKEITYKIFTGEGAPPTITKDNVAYSMLWELSELDLKCVVNCDCILTKSTDFNTTSNVYAISFDFSKNTLIPDFGYLVTTNYPINEWDVYENLNNETIGAIVAENDGMIGFILPNDTQTLPYVFINIKSINVESNDTIIIKNISNDIVEGSNNTLLTSNAIINTINDLNPWKYDLERKFYRIFNPDGEVIVDSYLKTASLRFNNEDTKVIGIDSSNTVNADGYNPTDAMLLTAAATTYLINQSGGGDSLVTYDSTTKQYTLVNDASDRTFVTNNSQTDTLTITNHITLTRDGSTLLPYNEDVVLYIKGTFTQSTQYSFYVDSTTPKSIQYKGVLWTLKGGYVTPQSSVNYELIWDRNTGLVTVQDEGDVKDISVNIEEAYIITQPPSIEITDVVDDMLTNLNDGTIATAKSIKTYVDTYANNYTGLVVATTKTNPNTLYGSTRTYTAVSWFGHSNLHSGPTDADMNGIDTLEKLQFDAEGKDLILRLTIRNVNGNNGKSLAKFRIEQLNNAIASINIPVTVQNNGNIGGSSFYVDNSYNYYDDVTTTNNKLYWDTGVMVICFGTTQAGDAGYWYIYFKSDYVYSGTISLRYKFFLSNTSEPWLYPWTTLYRMDPKE